MVDTPDGDKQPARVAERLVDDEPLPEPIDVAGRTLSILKEGARGGSLALAVGGLFLWRGLHSIRQGRVRGVVPAAIGVVAVRAGLRKRRSVSSNGETETTLDIETNDFDPTTETSDEDGSVSDEAYAAVRRLEGDRSTNLESASELTGTADDEERPRSDSDESVEPSADLESSELSVDDFDPRLDDDDGADLSETARADEPAEATGPAPEQAQPARSIDAQSDPVSGEPGPDVGDENYRNGSDEADESMRQDETDPDAGHAADDDTTALDENEEDEQDEQGR
ncbi:MSCRAMM family adhesin SdrC [Natronosalvus vescus]|uniref:MSCRAMM family adhesin SdrC n=1 Tax=Natronosalvus vescus TaxID=2953881 RepID=UPI0020911669|nr:MSCRAMM family adhesin SdrC [Natronosalvus vescus]